MLHQLSPLSTPFTLVSLKEDLDTSAVREVAPRALVRGGVVTPWASDRRSRVLVLDRCSRLVYQQSLRKEDQSFPSVEAAILSAQHDDPCGPCHVTSWQEASNLGVLSKSQQLPSERKETPGVSKSAHAPSSAADLPEESRATGGLTAGTTTAADEDTTDGEEETREDAAKKPERKQKKNKRKKGKNKKNKKRKQEEGMTMTNKPLGLEARDCTCRDEDADFELDSEPTQRCRCVSSVEVSREQRVRLDPASRDGRELVSVESSRELRVRLDQASRDGQRLVRLLEKLNEVLDPPTTDVTTVAKKPKSKQRNTKQQRKSLQEDINEGIEMVTEDEEFIEYPDKIDAFLHEDNILTEVDNFDKGLLGREYQERTEEADQTFRAGNQQDDIMADLLTDELTDHEMVIQPEVYVIQREETDDLLTDELTDNEMVVQPDVYVTNHEESNSQPRDEDRVWDAYKNGHTKETSKKGKKTDGEYKKERRIRNKYNVQELEERELEATMRDAMDAWDTGKGFAWKEVTLSPPAYDSASELDQRRRVVLYASDYETPVAEEEPISEKVTLLHSKIHPVKQKKHW